MPTYNTLQPAHPVLERLGGRRAVADHLGLSFSAVCRWCAPPPIGTGGRIPAKHWLSLMALAERQGKRLSVRALSGL